MTATTRFATADDVEGIWEVFRLGFGVAPEHRDRWVRGIDPARTLVVDAPDGTIAAAAHVRPFGQWFGGERVPLAGYSPVAVLPEHRGRGHGRTVTAGHLPDLRDRGEVIAGLFPASVALYRSVGFELAGSYLDRRIPSADLARIRGGEDVVVRRGRPADVAAVHACYARVGAGRDGYLDRSDQWWEDRLPADLGTKVLYVVDHPGDGDGDGVDGYAYYEMGKGRPPYDYSVQVTEVISDDPGALRALWRVVGSSGSQAPDTHVIGAAEDPLFLLLHGSDPSAVRAEIRWMLRLVDAPGAVAARGWRPSGAGRVDLQIDDPLAPWNAGRWQLEVAGGHGRLTSGGDGTVELGIGALSTLWAGYQPAHALAAAGLLRSADPAAVTVLDDLFAAAPPTLLDFY